MPPPARRSPPSTGAVLRHDPERRGFTSDNCSGAHPEVFSALLLANGGHQGAYGQDGYTARLKDTFRRHFGPAAEVFPVFNGTGANVVALQALTSRWGAVVCAERAHVNQEEGGGPEHVAGLKLLGIPSTDGKIGPRAVEAVLEASADEHSARPQVLSLTQATELGTCYTPKEVGDLAVCAHAHGLAVHMDGARLANAAASLDVPLSACTAAAGVDILSFGGTKNGLLFGECVVVLDPSRVSGTARLRKRTTQLASKMRFLSVQFEALLGGDLWHRSAARANAMARRLGSLLAQVEGVTVVRPVEVNSVFVIFPGTVPAALSGRYDLRPHEKNGNEVRLMCSFDTTEEDVRAFAAAVARAVDAREKGFRRP
ncbi:threonine aldolase family protein [Streptomyces sp. NPDC085942]|uniref:threonine aldolase family protein n=1 Tax=Streptomyces sp. NPDC085942 TaxID=3365743 RepID=UPI0037D60487